MRIVGRGFSRAYTVSFNGQPVTPVEVLPERVVVTVPEGAQTGPFLLSHGDDELQTEPFTVTAAGAAPTVTAMEPAAGAPGSEVTLRGQNFAARPTDNTVLFQGLAAVVQGAEPTALRVIVPVGAQSGPVTVRTAGGD